jgi:hypothetical protein
MLALPWLGDSIHCRPLPAYPAVDMVFLDTLAARSTVPVRRARIVAGAVLVLAACTPLFQRVGPAPGHGPATAASQITTHIWFLSRACDRKHHSSGLACQSCMLWSHHGR